MLGRLHRVVLWLRLAVVCLVLTGISAPATSVGYREAVVSIAEAREPAKQSAAPAPARQISEARSPAASVSGAASIAGHVAVGISPLPLLSPQRLFLINCALLC